MGTTPVFGFPYPDPSDLVANYPALGQQLAEDVEDEIIAASGLSLITAQAFTASSSVVLNGCFTSAYVNYKLIINIASSSNTTAYRLYFRAATVNTTDQNYGAGFGPIFTGATTEYFGRVSDSAFLEIMPSAANNANTGNFDIFGPQLARTTTMTGSAFNTNGGVGFFVTGAHLQTTQFDGFNLVPSVGNITGDLRVYGYKNS